jgi:hypothetical protein
MRPGRLRLRSADVRPSAGRRYPARCHAARAGAAAARAADDADAAPPDHRASAAAAAPAACDRRAPSSPTAACNRASASATARDTAAATSSTPAAAATASLSELHAEEASVLPIEDIERPQADVGDLLLAENDAGTERGGVGGRIHHRGGGCCSTGERQGRSCGPECRCPATALLGSLLRARHARTLLCWEALLNEGVALLAFFPRAAQHDDTMCALKWQ